MRGLKNTSLVFCLVWAALQGCGADDIQVPVSTVPVVNGSACAQSDQCQSGHCQNNFCCPSGECCSEAGDCPASFTVAPQCDAATTCQGTRQDATCVSNICGTDTAADDDTGCTDTTQAKDCAPYVPVFCTGAVAQVEPECGPACASDDNCVSGYHCDTTCQADLAAGLSCDEPSDCISGHCQNDFCCSSDDCCSAPGDCPSNYTNAPQCGNAVTCQGTRADATCAANTCGTSGTIEDDTGCTDVTQSKTCDPYVPVLCAGTADQTEPTCPTTCTLDNECVSGFHCDGTCVADLDAGDGCDEPSDCASNHCQNDFCCDSDDCCSQVSDCSGYAVTLRCDDTATCQGSYADATCASNICGTSSPVSDDSACAVGTQAKDCGAYLPVFCDGTTDQTEPSCPTSCNDDGDCIVAAHCDDTCMMDLPNGDGCDEPSDCINAYCQNGFCCDSGDCCSDAGDCPGGYTVALHCDDASTCQGWSADATCVSNICGTDSVILDDSACTSITQSKDCSTYLPVFCTGAADQTEPSCPAGCSDDGECITTAHCDTTCETDLNDGGVCNEDSDCISAHCQNDFCCESGECCSDAGDCSGSAVPPLCITVLTCQGTRNDATCSLNMCGTGSPIDDDSACTTATQSKTCSSPNPPMYCTGEAVQTEPLCPTCVPQMVISQVYGGGGNADAPYLNDFVELHNRSTAAVGLTGWSVQYAAATSSTWFITTLSGTVAAGGYFLVQLDAGSGANGAPLPTPDVIGTTVMSATNAKVVLVSATAVVTGPCATGPVVDMIGYGTADCSEGTAAPGLSNTEAAIRGGNGCDDTDDNSTDFVAGTPTPRNSATAALTCGC